MAGPTRRRLLGASVGLAATGIASARAQRGKLGERLYALVEEYARWPHHRTGTPEGKATVDWFVGQLRKFGANAQRWPYTYERYDHRISVKVRGRTIEALPLFYSTYGEFKSDKPFVRPVTLDDNIDVKDIVAALREAQAARAPLVILPTFGRMGGAAAASMLIGVDIDPDAPLSRGPTLLVAGDHVQALTVGPTEIVLNARKFTERDEIVIARLGDAVGVPTVITVPLTSWFTAAAERGSAIAVALEVAINLSKIMPITVIGTTGQELDAYGVRRLVAAQPTLEAYAILHVGSAVGAGVRGKDGKLVAATTRWAASSRPADDRTPLGGALRKGGFTVTPRFGLEAAAWAKTAGKDIPVLSFTGLFPQFHTPGDLPETTTSPALMEAAYDAVYDAARALTAL